jgi:hypothetical protein
MGFQLSAVSHNSEYPKRYRTKILAFQIGPAGSLWADG